VTTDLCPPLPADLYFLREGRIWVCHAEGGALEQIPIAEEAQGDVVVDYHITPDRRYIAYVTNAGELFILDRSRWVQTFLPTTGRILDQNGLHITLGEDGKTLLYLAWDVQPTRGAIEQGSGSGTILAMHALTPTLRQQTIAFCKGTPAWPCMGFKLSPDAGRIAMIDSRGVWTADIPPLDTESLGAESPAPRMVASHGEAPTLPLRHWSWSRDGQWLVLESSDAGQIALSLLDMRSPPERPSPGDTPDETPPDQPVQTITPHTVCSSPCTVDSSWGDSGLWVIWDTPDLGCAGRVNPGDVVLEDAPSRLAVQEPFCGLAGQPLHPTAPQVLQQYGLAVIHRGSPDLPAGLYALPVGPPEGASSDDDVTEAVPAGMAPVPLAFLPPVVTSAEWSPEGRALIVSDDRGAPILLIDLFHAATWDVQDLWEKAHTFRWASFINAR
jgi:hypothetical protein